MQIAFEESLIQKIIQTVIVVLITTFVSLSIFREFVSLNILLMLAAAVKLFYIYIGVLKISFFENYFEVKRGLNKDIVRFSEIIDFSFYFNTDLEYSVLFNFKVVSVKSKLELFSPYNFNKCLMAVEKIVLGLEKHRPTFFKMNLSDTGNILDVSPHNEITINKIPIQKVSYEGRIISICTFIDINGTKYTEPNDEKSELNFFLLKAYFHKKIHIDFKFI